MHYEQLDESFKNYLECQNLSKFYVQTKLFEGGGGGGEGTFCSFRRLMLIVLIVGRKPLHLEFPPNRSHGPKEPLTVPNKATPPGGVA